MHELGMAESALKAVLREAQARGATRVAALTLRIGELAAVDPEALRFAFAAVARGTPAEAAGLSIETVRAVAWCGPCGKEFAPASAVFCQCPECGNYSGQLRRGREIELARLELET